MGSQGRLELRGASFGVLTTTSHSARARFGAVAEVLVVAVGVDQASSKRVGAARDLNANQMAQWHTRWLIQGLNVGDGWVPVSGMAHRVCQYC